MSESAVTLRVKLLSEDAILPTRGSDGAAGYDLYASRDTPIAKYGRALVPTDIAIAIPPGYYGRIAPRSSAAWKYGLATGAGVIDPDYRGPIQILLFNSTDLSIDIPKGNRVAQLILEKIITPPVVKVDSLDDTARGAGGFGSTGV